MSNNVDAVNQLVLSHKRVIDLMEKVATGDTRNAEEDDVYMMGKLRQEASEILHTIQVIG